MLKEENFKKLKHCFSTNNDCLKIEGFVIAMLENFTNYSSKLYFIKNLIELFKEIDLDGNGILEFKELLQYIVDYQNKNLFENTSKKQDIQKIIKNLKDQNYEFDKFKISGHYLSNRDFKNEYTFKACGKNFVFGLYNQDFHFIEVYADNFADKILLDMKELLWNKLKYNIFCFDIKIHDTDICAITKKLYLLMENQLIIIDIKEKKITNIYKPNIEGLKGLKIINSHIIVLSDLKNKLLFYKIAKKLVLLQSYTLEIKEIKCLSINENRINFFTKLGAFYTFIYNESNNTIHNHHYTRPLRQHLIKGYLVLQNISIYVFWGYNNFLMLYLTDNFDTNPKKLIFHKNEIKNCIYVDEYEKMVSLDEGNIVVIWNPGDFTKHQVIIPRAPMIDIHIYNNNSAFMLFTKRGIYTAEVLEFEIYKQNINIIDFFYNEFIRKFILVTNKDVRFIDVLTGEIVYFIINTQYSLMKSHKLVDKAFGEIEFSDKCFQHFSNPYGGDRNNVLQLKCGEYLNAYDQSFRLLMVEDNYHLSLYNMKNFEKLKEITLHNSKTNVKLDKITCVKYSQYLDSIIVGYKSSVVKIFKTNLKYPNTWITKFLEGNNGFPISSIDSRKNIIITGAKNGSIAIWDVIKGNGITYPIMSSSKVSHLIIINHNSFIVFHRNGKAYYWKLIENERIEKIIDLKMNNISEKSYVTCGLLYQQRIYIATSLSELFFIDISNWLMDIIEPKLKSNKYELKVKEVISCKKYNLQDNIRNFLVERVINAKNKVTIDHQKIKKIQIEPSFNILIVHTDCVIKLYSLNLSLKCFIDIRDSALKHWNIDLEWIKWELQDLNQAFDLLEAIEDKKITDKEKEIEMARYFKENFLDIKGYNYTKNSNTIKNEEMKGLINKTDNDSELYSILKTLHNKKKLLATLQTKVNKNITKSNSPNNKKITNNSTENLHYKSRESYIKENNIVNNSNANAPKDHNKLLMSTIIERHCKRLNKITKKNKDLKEQISKIKIMKSGNYDNHTNESKDNNKPYNIKYKINFDVNRSVDFKYSNNLNLSLSKTPKAVIQRNKLDTLDSPTNDILKNYKHGSSINNDKFVNNNSLDKMSHVNSGPVKKYLLNTNKSKNFKLNVMKSDKKLEKKFVLPSNIKSVKAIKNSLNNKIEKLPEKDYYLDDKLKLYKNNKISDDTAKPCPELLHSLDY